MYFYIVELSPVLEFRFIRTDLIFIEPTYEAKEERKIPKGQSTS